MPLSLCSQPALNGYSWHAVGKLFDSKRTHSPFDVVAWHGNYAPYKYDLSRFHAMNTVTVEYDAPAPFHPLLPRNACQRTSYFVRTFAS